MKVNETSLRDAIIQYVEMVDRTQNHIHLRVTPDGDFYTTEDTSYCISEGEFRHAPNATITIKHEQGNGQCNLAEDWATTDDGIESIDLITEAALEDLRRARSWPNQ